MKTIFFIFSFILLNTLAFSQLKPESFLIMNQNTPNIHSFVDPVKNHFFYVDNSGFKYENNLTFVYYYKSAPYCCNYYEVKAIPKNWNIITVKDIVAYMEDKKNGFNFRTKKLFFVEYDRDRRIYKAYQADIIGWPRTD